MTPHVVAVCLTANRQQLTDRAVACFEEQTYANRSLFILDTGKVDYEFGNRPSPQVTIVREPSRQRDTIGALRNFACELINDKAAIVCTFDSDDFSHPNRIAEQVALLTESGAEVVGYNEMLFWRAASGPVDVDPMERTMPVNPGQAWIYTSQRPASHPQIPLGTSLMYRRSFWERNRFADGPVNSRATSEYYEFLRAAQAPSAQGIRAVSALHGTDWLGRKTDDEPRMTARIHGANATTYDIERQIAEGSKEWKRVPSWDSRVRELLA